MSPDKPNPAMWEKDSLPWIEKVVSESLAKARAREESLPALGPAPDALTQQLERLGKSLYDFATFADAPRPTIAEIDESFQNGEEELRHFLGTVESVRGRLAEWTDRAIG